jgi:hypothetical protein
VLPSPCAKRRRCVEAGGAGSSHLTAVVKNEHLAVLEGRHGAGISVEVRICDGPVSEVSEGRVQGCISSTSLSATAKDNHRARRGSYTAPAALLSCWDAGHGSWLHSNRQRASGMIVRRGPGPGRTNLDGSDAQARRLQ